VLFDDIGIKKERVGLMKAPSFKNERRKEESIVAAVVRCKRCDSEIRSEIVSVSVSTDLAVRLANNLGVTLVGFARGKRMNVYTSSWRVS
jgi:FdhD protein